MHVRILGGRRRRARMTSTVWRSQGPSGTSLARRRRRPSSPRIRARCREAKRTATVLSHGQTGSRRYPELAALRLQRLCEDRLGEVLTGCSASDEEGAEGEEVIQLRLVDGLDPILGSIQPRLRTVQPQGPFSGYGVHVSHIILLPRVSGKPPVSRLDRRRAAPRVSSGRRDCEASEALEGVLGRLELGDSMTPDDVEELVHTGARAAR